MKKAVKIKSGVVAAGLIIIIAFWGRIEIRQLTDKEEHTEAEDMIEIEGINTQTAYAGESESQENMELNGKDANMDDDIDSIEKINKYMIPEQSFDVTLDGWGEVLEADSLPWSPR